MVIITGIAACIAVKTLKGIDRQVTANLNAARAANTANRIAQRAFQFTHRPRLRMRRILLEWEDPNKPSGIRYTIANIGNAKATITRGIVKVAYFESTLGSLPIWPDFLDHPNVIPATIEPGGQTSCPFDNEELLEAFGNGRFISKSTLFFYGSIWYTDEAGNYRETSFLRKYDGTRFVPIDNPDYEYED